MHPANSSRKSAAVLDTSSGDAAPQDEPRTFVSRLGGSFAVWGVTGYLVTTGVLVALSLALTGGVLVYLIDDPAIHMSIAHTLAESGTWGVRPGEFQSASSSPLWTSILGVVAFVAPFALNVAPLLLNVGASIALILLLAKNQEFLRPGRDRPLDGLAVVAISVFVLFLPALTVLGMEHVLHMTLAVAVLILFTRRSRGEPLHVPGWLPYLLLVAATLIRFETAFLAAGLALATLAPGEGDQWIPTSRRLRQAIVIGATSAVPLALFAMTNRLAGQGWLPNSILAKGQGISGSPESSLAPLAVVNRLTTDPLVAGLTVAALLVIAAGYRRRRLQFPAIAFVVCVVLHVTLATVGWFERYQAYLIALGVYVLLQLGSEIAPASLASTRQQGTRRTYRAALVVGVFLLLAGPKVSLTAQVTRGVADTFEQRYQAAIFLDRYYDDDSIATGELGYISLEHNGPITDLFGLGDYEVLEARRAHGQRVPSAYWAKLAQERGIKVVAVYPFTLWNETPDNWILVGTWTLNRPTVTAFQDSFQFWVTDPSEVAPMQEHLREFSAELPDGVTLELDELASYRADQQLRGG